MTQCQYRYKYEGILPDPECLFNSNLPLHVSRLLEISPSHFRHSVGWLVVLRIYVASAVFQPYPDLEAGDNQSLKIQVARPGIEPRSTCPASQELNHSATAAPSDIQQVKWDQRMKCTATSYWTKQFFYRKTDRSDSFQELW